LSEQCAQAFSFGRVDRFHEPHPALKVRPEAGMHVPILALRPLADTISKYRLETIEVGSHDVCAPIGDEPRQMLPNALAHDARFAVMYGETLFAQNDGHVG
jgi:hypothetical protein